MQQRQRSVGVALVTHNAQAWLPETLDSILAQTYEASAIHVVDDSSRDATLEILAEYGPVFRGRGITWDVSTASSFAQDSKTRIAHNFAQAVRALRPMDFIALSDHDDLWYPNRLEHQARELESDSDALMVASNGELTASDSRTLFQAFGVSDDYSAMTPSDQLRFVLRHSVATGAASMLRSGEWMDQPEFPPPSGWLHDRWWSILAASRAGLRTDSQIVIQYRVHEGQQVGIDRGRQVGSLRDRLGKVGGDDISKLRQLAALRAHASPSCSGELTYPSLLRTFLFVR